MIATAIVGSQLDYCNSFLAGTSVSNLVRLQLVQNTLARVVSLKLPFSRILPYSFCSALASCPSQFEFQNSYIHFHGVVISTAIPAISSPSLQITYTCMQSLRSSFLSSCVPTRKTAMVKSKSFHLLHQISGSHCHVIIRPFLIFLFPGSDSNIPLFSSAYPKHFLASR